MKITALVLFVLTYICLLIFQKHRAYVALTSALLFVVLGILPFSEVGPSVDWNVILMLLGTMGMVSLFIESKMPVRMADILLEKLPNVKWAIVVLSLFAGFISAFVDNVATVLIVAPIGLAIAKKLGVSPVPVVISIAVSSNLQGAATLVGDTTSILLGGYANMDFLDFFFMQGRPGMFWVVELGALCTIPVLLYLFRKENNPISSQQRAEVTDYFPTVILCTTVVLLICASFIPQKPAITNGLICTGLCALGLIRAYLKYRSLSQIQNALKEIDYKTLLLLCGLFIVIAGITRAGVIDDISALFVQLGGDNIFVIYSLIVWGSVLFSAFIDNIPYVATMLPVVTGIAQILGVEPYLLYFGLLTGATLGGNLTPIGASANIVGIGILQKDGYSVSVKDFMRIGVPFTLVAVLAGYLAIWFLWA